jgi:hypothetical protein
VWYPGAELRLPTHWGFGRRLPSGEGGPGATNTKTKPLRGYSIQERRPGSSDAVGAGRRAERL